MLFWFKYEQKVNFSKDLLFNPALVTREREEGLFIIVKIIGAERDVTVREGNNNHLSWQLTRALARLDYCFSWEIEYYSLIINSAECSDLLLEIIKLTYLQDKLKFSFEKCWKENCWLTSDWNTLKASNIRCPAILIDKTCLNNIYFLETTCETNIDLDTQGSSSSVSNSRSRSVPSSSAQKPGPKTGSSISKKFSWRSRVTVNNDSLTTVSSDDSVFVSSSRNRSATER